MKMSLSKGASGGVPNDRSSYSARPGRKGLYGKKPVAKTTMQMGRRRLAATSSAALSLVPFFMVDQTREPERGFVCETLSSAYGKPIR